MAVIKDEDLSPEKLLLRRRHNLGVYKEYLGNIKYAIYEVPYTVLTLNR